MMERIALSHPEISFKFINNGQIRLHTSGNGQLKDIIYHIYGRDIAANLLEVSGEFDGFSVSGYIGKPVISRGNRNFESYFINSRYIKSSLIAKAIEDAYHGFMMQHKYPFVVLSLSVDGRLVDVNVHPNKMELRFSNGEQLYTRLAGLIAETLRNRELITNVSVKEEKKTEQKPVYDKKEIPEPFESRRREQRESRILLLFLPMCCRRSVSLSGRTAPMRRNMKRTAAGMDGAAKYPAAQKPEEEKPDLTDMPAAENPAGGHTERTDSTADQIREEIRYGDPPVQTSSPTIWQKRRSFSPGGQTPAPDHRPAF